ncbi:V-type ATP synthase subunit D [Photobacterium lutimaris]|uniref:V-type ATP synthase subunit D n=1 Tax=Photobacterium lutimaris TaxID=388278 RepID=A0A2T3IXR9_9GAMM|nr:V-type ATP synthase subunit D [Photobacterium lutimaris]PSU33335.1 V-type ATP synthase subunit D [Photobacterium lutimaris]TDR75074.1 V/A-type H+-transporting ATPase subunit D [Photobacterium lutimaris]
MAKVALNKSSLNKQKRSLKTYNRYLPALELKRQQLMLERKKAEQALEQAKQRVAELRAQVEEAIPMLACKEINVNNLVKVTNVKLATQNIVGCRVPIIESVDVAVTPYSYLARPHWVDNVVRQLKEMVRLRVELAVCQQRYELISDATRITSQRVNLFSKVLIPDTQDSIKRIGIYLSDQERAAVMNAKLSKQKVLAQHEKTQGGQS